MSVEILSAPVNGQEVQTGKYRVRVESMNKIRRRMANRVARHEAKHAFVALELGIPVIVATDVPGSDGSLGHVETGVFSAAVAAAPHATGEDGGWGDLAMIEYRGESVGAAESTGKSILSGNDEEVEAIASLISEKRTVGGGEIADEVKRVRGGDNYIVHIKTPDGDEKRILKFGVKNQDVFIDENEIGFLPKAA